MYNIFPGSAWIFQSLREIIIVPSLPYCKLINAAKGRFHAAAKPKELWQGAENSGISSG